VLFVENSLTFVNEMPDLLTHVVDSDRANRPIFAVRFAPGGYTLAQDVDNHDLSALLDEARWDFVVLQENSNYSQLEGSYRDTYTGGPARVLPARIRSISAQPLLFMTWGYRNGYPAIPGDSYQSMHRDPTSSYTAGLTPSDAAFLQRIARSVTSPSPS
jgi:hypothetical protein